MSIAPGTRLGVYEVTSLLGEGGMGQVYRARDTRLGREVAIKVLPAAFTADAERLARFEREAKLLASLNHTNIATIHGLEETGGVRALVMELVPGETLAEHLARGPMAVEECLPIFLQIAEALEYAHEHGIVHRDLKPANVKLTPEGKIKVLDFGLAKALDTAASTAGGTPGNSPTMSPTITAMGTQAGMIMGTAAYMSPEQARGRPVDRRADIWAFGVMMLEALSGRVIFAGETVSDILAAVLRAEPDHSTLPSHTPAVVRRMLGRALRKDPRARLQSIGDARIAIQEALLPGASEEPWPATSAAAPATSRPGWAVLAVIGLVALAIGAGLGWALRRPSQESSRSMRFALALPDDLTYAAIESPQLALSRDGTQQVAVVTGSSGTPKLLYRRTDEIEPRVLPDSDGAGSPFFSPDGKWVGAFRNAQLIKIPIGGGPPVFIAASSGQSRGAAWSIDGYIYFGPDSNVGLYRVSQNGGPVEPATTLDDARGERTHRWPDVLPDGSALIFTSDTQASTEYYDDARIEVVRIATGERKVLMEGSSQARYLTSGHLLFARGGSLFAVPFDAASLEVIGTPVQVAQRVSTIVGTGATQFAVSESGAALWAPGGTEASLWLPTWIDRQGSETPANIEPGIWSEISLSPDSKKVALVGGQGGISDLWVADLERGAVTRLTFNEFVTSPTWTPDSLRLAYGTRLQGSQGNTWQVAIKPADGSRDAQTVVQGERGHSPTSFSPDGRVLLFDRLNAPATARDVWSVAIDGPAEPKPVLEGPFYKIMAEVSPDGRWLAYVSDQSGTLGVYVRPFPAGDGRWQISTPEGAEPRWSHDGREIYYRSNGALWVVKIDSAGGGFKASRPERILDRVPYGGNSRTYSVGTDGRFLVGRSREVEPPSRYLYFDLGFAAEVTRLVASQR